MESLANYLIFALSRICTLKYELFKYCLILQIYCMMLYNINNLLQLI
jgi:hypothetical protein